MNKGRAVILNEKWSAIQVEIEQILMSISAPNYSGSMLGNFLLSKSIELLVLATESLCNNPGKPPSYIKVKKDKEKIIAARDYINQNLNTAPNLSKVAQVVQLNEYKLKHGFKEIFGTTLFKYLSARRWQLAKQYLLDTERSAASISEQLGYASPQHFSNMFKKQFGQSPIGFRNNPKNVIG